MKVDVQLLEALEVLLGQAVGQSPDERVVDACDKGLSVRTRSPRAKERRGRTLHEVDVGRRVPRWLLRSGSLLLRALARRRWRCRVVVTQYEVDVLRRWHEEVDGGESRLRLAVRGDEVDLCREANTWSALLRSQNYPLRSLVGLLGPARERKGKADE